MEATTIKIYLIHGKPNGLRTAKLSNWSGKAISAPRTELFDLFSRNELQKVGLYLLTGVDSKSDEPAIYIGESENVAKRLKKHADKDFWNSVTVFVSKDENLTKAHVRYIENILITKANESSTCKVMNNASSGSKLSESDSSEMDIFLNKCLQLMPILGIPHFNNPHNESHSNDEKLYFRSKDIEATGNRTANGFVVYKGSQAVLEHLESAKSIKAKREDLFKRYILKINNAHYEFTKDFKFGSPSTAGGVVNGGNINGLTNWKNKDGKNLKEIESDINQDGFKYDFTSSDWSEKENDYYWIDIKDIQTQKRDNIHC